MKLATFFSLSALIIPGLDYRFHWSSVPAMVVAIACITLLSGYIFFFFVLKENSYASRIIEVTKDQKVISTGPYAVVRHPMYLAILVMYLATPVVLGSWWALITVVPLPLLIVSRIRTEEEMLLQELSGYREYTRKVKYRLLPWVW